MSYATIPPNSAAPGALEIVVFAKRDRSTHPLPPSGLVRIGRSSGNDIRIEHRSVSRHHLHLYVGDKLEVEDVGSANGTWLFSGTAQSGGGIEETLNSGRDRRLGSGVRTSIGMGDMVRIGAVLLSIQRRSPSSRAPTAAPSRAPLGHLGKPGTGPPVLVDSGMKSAYALARKAAASNISVLILGETGVGKDVLAETIHYCSPRASGPLVRLNCAALSETLLESELFGFQRGAFTGATQAKEGLLESAHKGTVFLDEIGELPMSTQVKLLNVLETSEVTRVGATKPRRIDIRFIAATNRDLTAQIHRGRFRKDLYFRINAVTFTVPPLRERRSEIEPLGRYFLAHFCKLAGLREPELSPEALECMLDYAWPGNVRELKNAMERAPILCGEGPVLPVHLPSDHRLSLAGSTPWEMTEESDDPWSATTTVGLREVAERTEPSSSLDDERTRVLQALEACGGNQSRAAKVLGISRRTLVNRLDQFGLPRPRKTS